MILGDSGEYELLTEAVELSKDVDGLLVEIGLRLGMGTKTIIDACLQHRPGSTVISIDPFGSILYTCREADGPIRLDYTNDMYKRVMLSMSEYVIDKNVNWVMLKMTDNEFFNRFAYSFPIYELEHIIYTKYAMCHLDGVHTVHAISDEVEWFNDRMDSGATIVIDDCTPDFFDIEPINRLFESLNWELYKQGVKKNIYRKL